MEFHILCSKKNLKILGLASMFSLRREKSKYSKGMSVVDYGSCANATNVWFDFVFRGYKV